LRFRLSLERQPPEPAKLIWKYDRAEIIADGAVHAIGVSLGLVGAVAIVFAASNSAQSHELVPPIYLYDRLNRDAWGVSHLQYFADLRRKVPFFARHGISFKKSLRAAEQNGRAAPRAAALDADVAALECWNKTLLQVGEEQCRVHCAIEHKRCDDCRYSIQTDRAARRILVYQRK
jgi:hypothetical protein